MEIKEESLVERKEFKEDGKAAFTQKAVSLMLKKALFQFIQNYKTGVDTRIEVQPIDDNIFHWRARFRQFGFSSKLQSDITMLDSRYDRDYIEFEIKFHLTLHPFYPPEINSVYPRLEDFFVAAIVCMDELLLEKWKPVTKVGDILNKIWSMLAEHGRVNAALEINNPNNYHQGAAYGKAEQMLCRLSQVTSMPPRTYTRIGLKRLKMQETGTKVVELQRQLSGEEGRGNMMNYISKLAQQRQKRKDIKSAFSEVVATLMLSTLSGDFTYVVKNSALLSVIESYLRGSNQAKMNKHSKMYLSVLTVVRTLVNVPALHSLLFIPISKAKLSLYDYLKPYARVSLKTNVDALLVFLAEAIEWRMHYYASQLDALKLKPPVPKPSMMKSEKKDASLRCPVCRVKCEDWSTGELHIQECIASVQGALGHVSIRDDYSRFNSLSACPFCRAPYKGKTLNSHCKECWCCPMCTRPVTAKHLCAHVETCTKWYREDKEEQEKVDLLRKAQTNLETCQQEALKFVKDKARIASESKRKSLEQRFVQLGMQPSDLDVVNRYIRNEAPIIIHFNPIKVLHHFIKDTHYRNLFEVGTGGGCTNKQTRSGWEATIFNGAYEKAKPFHRPKYGVLNFARDPCGVRQCYSYGDSYMLLRNVRLRTTFAQKDTSGVGNISEMATCEYYMHVMSAFSDQELKDAAAMAGGKKQYTQGSAQATYREVQIHGEVRLDKDVTCIVIHKKYKTNTDICAKLEQFSEKHDVPHIWME